MKKADPPVIVEQSFLASKSELWAAITEIDQMTQWFFDNIPDFKAVVGFETQFVIKNEGRVFPHQWKIMEVIPQQKIVYNWRYEGYAGDSMVSFELIENDAQTTLRLTHQVLESFPQDIPEFTRESCLGGWNYFIKESLSKYLIMS